MNDIEQKWLNVLGAHALLKALGFLDAEVAVLAPPERYLGVQAQVLDLPPVVIKCGDLTNEERDAVVERWAEVRAFWNNLDARERDELVSNTAPRQGAVNIIMTLAINGYSATPEGLAALRVTP